MLKSVSNLPFFSVRRKKCFSSFLQFVRATQIYYLSWHVWRVISERIHKRKMNPHFKTQRHLSEMLCRSSSVHTKLNGHFPFCTNDLYHFCTASHSQTPWKNPLGNRRIWCYQTQFFQKTWPGQPTPNILGKRRDKAASGTRLSFQKWLPGCIKSWENQDWVTCWPKDCKSSLSVK